jgi:hypothetical protein
MNEHEQKRGRKVRAKQAKQTPTAAKHINWQIGFERDQSNHRIDTIKQ